VFVPVNLLVKGVRTSTPKRVLGGGEASFVTFISEIVPFYFRKKCVIGDDQMGASLRKPVQSASPQSAPI